jgi:hypothetical protein
VPAQLSMNEILVTDPKAMEAYTESCLRLLAVSGPDQWTACWRKGGVLTTRVPFDAGQIDPVHRADRTGRDGPVGSQAGVGRQVEALQGHGRGPAHFHRRRPLAGRAERRASQAL